MRHSRSRSIEQSGASIRTTVSTTKGATFDINNVSFNQDGQCFVVALDSGLRIFNSDPLRETARREYHDGGYGMVEMLYKYNYIALVGGGVNPRSPPNQLVLYDDKSNKIVVTIDFRSEIRNVRLRKDRFSTEPQKLYTFETCYNFSGVIALCSCQSNNLVAFPARQKGHVQIVDISDANRLSTIIQAHENRLTYLAFNPEGTKIATASAKGTLIRVFDVETGQLLNELRRGTDHAEIFCISFSPDSSRLCISSDKGTVHVFNLDVAGAERLGVYEVNSTQEDAPNRQLKLKFVKDILPTYFSSQWSFAHFKVSEAPCVVAFGQERNTIIAVCRDGTYYKYTFDLIRGGEGVRQAFARFLHLNTFDQISPLSQP